MGPITRFGNSVAETFREIKEAISPQKHAAIGRIPATKRNAALRPTPFFQRLSRQIVKEQDGQPVQKKVSACLSFGSRFQMLVFSTRLKFTSTLAELEALKGEVMSFRKALKKAASGSASASVPPALTELIASIDSKLVQQDPQRSVPAARGPKYGGW